MNVFEKIELQQKGKENTAPWMVGEQLKDICRRESAAAELVEKDLDIKEMSLEACEKKIKAWADAHKKGNCAVVPPNVAEGIYAALADKTGKTIPEACDDISVCEKCQMRHLCTASHELPETQIDDGELEEAIDRKNELSPAYREYGEVNDKIKKLVGEREKVISGKYIVTSKIVNIAEHTVAAQQQRRLSVKRL